MRYQALLGQDGTYQIVDASDANRVVATGVPSSEVNAAVQQFEAKGSDIRLFANSIPSAFTFDKLVVPDQASNDIVYHEFYDSSALTTAAVNQPTLFKQPAADIYNSNLPGNGRLDNAQRFFQIGIRFELENNDATNPLDIVDVKECFRLGTYQFWVGEKIYNSSKLMKYIVPNAFSVLNTKYYAVSPFLTWKLPIPIAIGKESSFKAPIVLTAAALDNTTRIFGYMCGFWYRAVQ